MTWLSEIEGYNKRVRESNEIETGWIVARKGTYPETPSERMARVIREQSEIIKVTKAFMLSDWNFHDNSCTGFGYHHELMILLNNLSRDVKELIDDTTAPSST